ncbi:hypothetical protein SAMN05661044_00154 [Olivibacter domesticus]|uniref:Uncharacterized protein n=1 Tax=Olivibacter domesticus TaxID=407022 RepID=A0A1H7GPU3_OLID1|nr:hypothetical protein SAMN05661044_00154 [Olivibacter domesticus]
MAIKKTVSQIALGLAVVGLGATASAFTNTEVQSNIVRYYSTTGNLTDTDPANFIYVDGTSDDCTPDMSKQCSALFDIGENSPEPNEAPPAGSSYQGSALTGDSPHQQ